MIPKQPLQSEVDTLRQNLCRILEYLEYLEGIDGEGEDANCLDCGALPHTGSHEKECQLGGVLDNLDESLELLDYIEGAMRCRTCDDLVRPVDQPSHKCSTINTSEQVHD